MTSPTRVRVVTPEHLDALAANLVNTAGTSLATAVANKAGTGTPTTTGSTTAVANSLMQRDANGRSQVATPSVSADIATKGYVDTTVGGYVATSSRGVASGVASLDATGYVPSPQIAPLFPRNLGSGTTFPASRNLGDLYTHTGVGCAFRWGGTQWEQVGRCTVANRTARNSLINNYKSILPLGFQVTQTNFGWMWRLDTAGWVYAGWEGSSTNSPWFAGPVFRYQTLNQPYGNNVQNAIASWTFSQAGTGDTERELVTLGTSASTYGGTNNSFTFNDRGLVALNAFTFSDAPQVGVSKVFLSVPGGAKAIAGGVLDNTVERSSGYGGSGTLEQPTTFIGYVEPGSIAQVIVYQANPNGTNVNYNSTISISFLPS